MFRYVFLTCRYENKPNKMSSPAAPRERGRLHATASYALDAECATPSSTHAPLIFRGSSWPHFTSNWLRFSDHLTLVQALYVALPEKLQRAKCAASFKVGPLYRAVRAAQWFSCPRLTRLGNRFKQYQTVFALAFRPPLLTPPVIRTYKAMRPCLNWLTYKPQSTKATANARKVRWSGYASLSGFGFHAAFGPNMAWHLGHVSDVSGIRASQFGH
jgi:hypothetical protein